MPESKTKREEISVLTFDVDGYEAKPGQPDVLAAAILEMNADVVMLQESKSPDDNPTRRAIDGIYTYVDSCAIESVKKVLFNSVYVRKNLVTGAHVRTVQLNDDSNWREEKRCAIILSIAGFTIANVLIAGSVTQDTFYNILTGLKSRQIAQVLRSDPDIEIIVGNMGAEYDRKSTLASLAEYNRFEGLSPEEQQKVYDEYPRSAFGSKIKYASFAHRDADKQKVFLEYLSSYGDALDAAGFSSAFTKEEIVSSGISMDWMFYRKNRVHVVPNSLAVLATHRPLNPYERHTNGISDHNAVLVKFERIQPVA
jgi:exonuclease III